MITKQAAVTTGLKWGRDESDWAVLKAAAVRFIGEQARLGQMPSYSALNDALIRRTGIEGFDFDTEHDRAAMGALLGELAVEHQAEVGALMSCVIRYQNSNDAGTGFYRLAEGLGMLSERATADQRLAFWIQQTIITHDHYARGGTR